MKVRKLVGIWGILALLSLLVIPMAVFAADTDTGTTEVTGNPTATIDITAPTEMLTFTLIIGGNSNTGTLNVLSNIDWTCKVKDADTTNTNGFMTSWNGTAYDTSLKLDNAMHVLYETAPTADVTLPTEANIVAGTEAGQSDDAGENFTIKFSQVVEYGDERLATGNNYRIVVTFSAAATV